jgi:hypothetical protein
MAKAKAGYSDAYAAKTSKDGDEEDEELAESI